MFKNFHIYDDGNFADNACLKSVVDMIFSIFF